MYCIRNITADLIWLGGNDRRLALFESAFPIPSGVSYNSYLLIDEKTVLLDTVDRAISTQFFENLEHALAGRKLDYLVVNHMEPDHCATMDELVLRHPEVTIVCNTKTLSMIHQFFTFDVDSRVQVIKEGDTLSTGAHTLTFVMAPMVHWPEAMVTYDLKDKILFSADAFGTFGAFSGHLFADQLDFTHDLLDEARRYYTNIVGKYGPQVQALLKKAAGLEISMICPLHGPIWRSHIELILDKYQKWSTYTPEEEDGVLILYASVYGNTENAVEILANQLSELGCKKIALYDVSVTHPSYLVAEAFKYGRIVFASTTYNAGVFCNMESLLHDLVAHNLQNRTVAFLQNGSWAPTAGKLMSDLLSPMKNLTVLPQTVTLKSSLKEEQLDQISALAEALMAPVSVPSETSAAPKKKFVCKLCGYVYEGDSLPADFICPLCKRGVEFFEPMD